MRARQESFRSKVNSEVKINPIRAARFRTGNAIPRRVRAREAQNLASNFLGRLTRASPYRSTERRPPIFYCRPTNMFFHTRRFREPERRYRTESPGDTLRPSYRSSFLGRPRGEDSFARG